MLAVTLLAPRTAVAGEVAPVLAEIDADPNLGRAIWAILAEDERGSVLAARNADTLMATGSVRKLFTAALVAECEDLSAPIVTEVFLAGAPGANGVWNGSLVIAAKGDPTIGGRDEYESDRLRRFRPIAGELVRRGIRSLAEGVVVDVSSFEALTIGGAWKSDNLPFSYAAPIDAAAFNENAIAALIVPRGCGRPVVEVDPPWYTPKVEAGCNGEALEVLQSGAREIVVRGSIAELQRDTVFAAVRDPGESLGDAMRIALAESGIAAGAVSVRRTSPPGWTATPVVRVGAIESPPVGAMLDAVLAASSNLYSEMLFKRVSRHRGAASWDESLAIEHDFLVRRAGLEPGSFRFDDGCGLSVENVVTPRSTVALLRYLRTESASARFWESVLAKPGEEGTLRRRLPQFKGRLFAKTGTVDGVASLAGWVRRADGSIAYFAIFVNNHATAGRDVNRAIDRIVSALADP
ncbi:MAG: D-alanyl-D-alanine carboxypeptidase/D-alanyl-D-alanine-endopeptidase [Thermoanaerobaculia bacterium]|nr:D-alanyl-D-alanine carboxypeptidase/D-alanyl-D-alanine-endopeptidase [Thermoanaerobaculia bacterium]